MKKAIKLPKFKNEDEERDFWANINLAEYFEADDFRQISFPNLKPSTKTISLRLPLIMLDRIKTIANAKDVPYQSYIKMVLAEKIQEEENRRPRKK